MNGLPLSLALLLISSTTFAAEESDDPCTVQGGGVMAGYACVAQRYKVADDQLNAEYKKAIQRTEEEQTALRENWPNTELVSLLRSAQRAWLKFRDAECQFTGISSTPSPWQGVQVEECKLRMTIERTEHLKGVHSG
ncbi:lysozyme inhibitor LprI family protein [Ectopseudomonas chengduensis]|jgi:uncharacterized protein YecT (DUF1311 family)|nr:lysozyme inhibitor LprI family protein [Pseudomonas chengduensis]WKC38467.1 lysozyme inhibitor LprI family protein [Pseudomonas chengduensis]